MQLCAAMRSELEASEAERQEAFGCCGMDGRGRSASLELGVCERARDGSSGWAL